MVQRLLPFLFIGAGAVSSLLAQNVFIPVTPCRIADTRSTTPIFGGGVQAFTVSGNCGIPTSATAYVLNVTAIPTVGPLS